MKVLTNTSSYRVMNELIRKAGGERGNERIKQGTELTRIKASNHKRTKKAHNTVFIIGILAAFKLYITALILAAVEDPQKAGYFPSMYQLFQSVVWTDSFSICLRLQGCSST